MTLVVTTLCDYDSVVTIDVTRSAPLPSRFQTLRAAGRVITKRDCVRGKRPEISRTYKIDPRPRCVRRGRGRGTGVFFLSVLNRRERKKGALKHTDIL
jgi:hypothetical protein